MRILFAALHNGYYRNLDSVVEELARRGHEIYLGAEREDSAFGGQPIVDTADRHYANVTYGRVAVRDPESLFLPARIRFAIDYLRYLEPVYIALIRSVASSAGAHAGGHAAVVEVAGCSPGVRSGGS